MLRYYVVPLEVVEGDGETVMRPALPTSVSWVGQPNLSTGTYIIKTPDVIETGMCLADTLTQYVDPWMPGVAVKTDEVRQYEGVSYRCIQGHTTQDGWEPPDAPALWTRYRPPGAITQWRQPFGAHDAYALGDVVTHKNGLWESKRAANVWEPGTFDSGWVEADQLGPEASARGLVLDDLRKRWGNFVTASVSNR